ncbi:MAG: RagB/SusD family nutrient uptake outer membrane protein [Gemmatimonadota bacterium]
MTMTTQVTRIVSAVLLAAGLFIGAGCDLDQLNPNAPVQEESLDTVEGVIALAVGMQGQYADAVEDFIVPPSLVTDEWGTESRALVSYKVLLTGVGIDPSFDNSEAPFVNAYRVIRSADLLIENAPNVGLGPGFQAGVVALARLYRAMSLGTIIQVYQEVPIDVSVEGPIPQSRQAVLTEVIALLESARSDLAGVSEADLAGFRNRVLGAGFDLQATIDAMLARYYLISGQYQQAIQAADRVDPAASSVLTYTSTTDNPVFALAFLLGYVQPLLSFVEQAEAGDGRTAYWVDLASEPFAGDPDSTLQTMLKYSTPTEPYPVYIQDEIKLIKAEAQARSGDLDGARLLINEVRTDATASATDPAANLPALPADQLSSLEAVLAQIAYERRYELFMQGTRWEDMRRLDDVIATEPILDFLPYPQNECLNNPADVC